MRGKDEWYYSPSDWTKKVMGANRVHCAPLYVWLGALTPPKAEGTSPGNCKKGKREPAQWSGCIAIWESNYHWCFFKGKKSQNAFARRITMKSSQKVHFRRTWPTFGELLSRFSKCSESWKQIHCLIPMAIFAWLSLFHFFETWWSPFLSRKWNATGYHCEREATLTRLLIGPNLQKIRKSINSALSQTKSFQRFKRRVTTSKHWGTVSVAFPRMHGYGVSLCSQGPRVFHVDFLNQQGTMKRPWIKFCWLGFRALSSALYLELKLKILNLPSETLGGSSNLILLEVYCSKQTVEGPQRKRPSGSPHIITVFEKRQHQVESVGLNFLFDLFSGMNVNSQEDLCAALKITLFNSCAWHVPLSACMPGTLTSSFLNISR